MQVRRRTPSTSGTLLRAGRLVAAALIATAAAAALVIAGVMLCGFWHRNQPVKPAILSIAAAQVPDANRSQDAVLRSASQDSPSPGLREAVRRKDKSAAEKGIGYAEYYPPGSDRPNTCTQHASSIRRDDNIVGEGYVPFIGTSAIRDSQLLVLRLYYSMDYPVKHFIIVVAKEVLESYTGLGYQVRHLLEHGTNVVVVTCEQRPSAAEGWNAVMQQFPQEEWGVYAATDTSWEPGSLRNLSAHMWEGVYTGSVDLGLMKWSNMEDKDGVYNAFAMTRAAVSRFGMFDENLYPAYFEERDLELRNERMEHPLVITQFSDVFLVHGSRQVRGYRTGIALPGDPQDTAADSINALAGERFLVNANYIYRKWGCAGEQHQMFAPWDTCKFKTPFNKSVPVWYWQAGKKQRQQDLDLKIRRDGQPRLEQPGTNRLVFYLPTNYAGWVGYAESQGTCRLSGELGKIKDVNATIKMCV